jgi:hypothetical protein
VTRPALSYPRDKLCGAAPGGCRRTLASGTGIESFLLDAVASQQGRGEISLIVRIEPDLIHEAMNALRGYGTLFAPAIAGLTDTAPIYEIYERMRQANQTKPTILLLVECQTTEEFREALDRLPLRKSSEWRSNFNESEPTSAPSRISRAAGSATGSPTGPLAMPALRRTDDPGGTAHPRTSAPSISPSNLETPLMICSFSSRSHPAPQRPNHTCVRPRYLLAIPIASCLPRLIAQPKTQPPAFLSPVPAQPITIQSP